jgi:hypothetical protein
MVLADKQRREEAGRFGLWDNIWGRCNQANSRKEKKRKEVGIKTTGTTVLAR